MFLIDPYRFGVAGASVDPYWSNVVLLAGFDGADNSTAYVDDSPSQHTFTNNGNAKITRTGPAISLGAATFDGSGDWIDVPDHADWDFGTGEFTIEMWVQFAGSGDRTILSRDNGFINGAQFCIELVGGNLRLTTGGASRIASAAFTPSGSTWYYICAQRVNVGPGTSTTFYLHVGTAGGSAAVHASVLGNVTDNLTISDPLALAIGRYEGHGSVFNYFNGLIDEIRITKGVARYGSGSFAVPTAAFSRTMAFSGIPVISTANGFYGVGDTLTITDAAYSGGVSSARVWRADGVDIVGATGTSFVLTSSELGKQITVRQTITAPDSSTLSADSAATPVIVTPTFQTDTRIAGAETRIAGTDTRVTQIRTA